MELTTKQMYGIGIACIAVLSLIVYCCVINPSMIIGFYKFVHGY